MYPSNIERSTPLSVHEIIEALQAKLGRNEDPIDNVTGVKFNDGETNNTITIVTAVQSDNHTATLPNKSGTFAMTDDLSNKASKGFVYFLSMQ